MPTRALVHAGACGYTAAVHAVSLDNKTIQLTIHSPCSMLQEMNPDLQNLPWRKGLLDTFFTSAVYKSADRHVRHVDCPVPAALIKAAMVELGMAAPVNASIIMHKQSEKADADAG
jgi:translation elongation factor EF-Tu-like GTPase